MNIHKFFGNLSSVKTQFKVYNYHDLLGSPGIQIDRLDFAYVYAKVSVYSGASDTQKYTEVPTGPSWS